jgi:hypothetical protein
MTAAISFTLVIKALHVMAAFAAYGLPFAYPLFIPLVRRHHPRALPGVHDIQHKLSVGLTGPGTAALLAFGIYLATKEHQWDQPYVGVGIAILAVIIVAGGMIVRWTAELATLATAAVGQAAPDATTVTFGAAYDRVYRQYLLTETGLGVLVLVAIFFMVVKP